MNILDYALAKQLFGGSGNGEVSGTIDITANGSYNVSKYARADVNIPDTSGSPIEVAELPTPTEQDVGKVYLNQADGNYYVGEQSVAEIKAGEPLGNKICFDTSVNPNKYMDINPQFELVVATDATNPDAMYGLMAMGGGGLYLIVIMAMTESGAMPVGVVYADSDAMTVEDVNAMVGAQLGLTISAFGWQTEVLDTSAYANYVVQVNNSAQLGNCFNGGVQSAFNKIIPNDAGTEILDSFIAGNLTEINSNATGVKKCAFRSSNVTSVSLPKATTIGEEAFYECTVLQNVDLPSATYIDVRAFGQCSSLISVDLPSVITINGGAFQVCVALEKVVANNVTSIWSSAFDNCTALTSIDFPLVEEIYSYAFRGCEALTRINLPNARFIEEHSFDGCTALTNVTLPSLEMPTSYIFGNCSQLRKIDLPNANYISAFAFANCPNLVSVIIGTNQTTVAPLENKSAFNGCYHILGTTHSTYNPTGAKDGYIYVPDNLVEAYKSATNWSTYADQIKGISELPE